jgi:UDPglucose 6-dehydrogenase
VPNLTLAKNPYELAAGCDALVLVTEWNEFKHLDLARLRSVMKTPVCIDGRNVYEPEVMRQAGFIYRGIGRGYGGKGCDTAEDQATTTHITSNGNVLTGPNDVIMKGSTT